jgi:hypothetical protein
MGKTPTRQSGQRNEKLLLSKNIIHTFLKSIRNYRALQNEDFSTSLELRKFLSK